MRTGCIQVYTGNGKGKTTASLGLLLRAAGAGKRICFCQFIKTGETSEIKTLTERFPEVTVKQFGRPGFIMRNPSEEDIAAAQAGLEELRAAITSNDYDVVIADEANTAVDMGLLSTTDLVELARSRNNDVELILTGRNAPIEIIELADLVTDMQKVKHYFDNGVPARTGIEK